MVGRWGMSEAIGLVTVLGADGQHPVLGGSRETSEATQGLIDHEIRRLTESAHREVHDLLAAHREQLDSLARALVEVETLDEIDAYVAAAVPNRPLPVVAVPARNGRLTAKDRTSRPGAG